MSARNYETPDLKVKVLEPAQFAGNYGGDPIFNGTPGGGSNNWERVG